MDYREISSIQVQSLIFLCESYQRTPNVRIFWGCTPLLREKLTRTWKIQDRQSLKRWLIHSSVLPIQLSDGYHFAAWSGNVALLQKCFVAENPIPWENDQGWTALQLAAWNIHIPIVKSLLSYPVATEMILKQNRKYNGATALHFAAWNGDKALVRLLVEYGANTSLRANGQLASTWADKGGFYWLARELRTLESGGSSEKSINETLHQNVTSEESTWQMVVKAPLNAFGRDRNVSGCSSYQAEPADIPDHRELFDNTNELPRSKELDNSDEDVLDYGELTHSVTSWTREVLVWLEYGQTGTKHAPKRRHKYKRKIGRGYRWREDHQFQQDDCESRNGLESTIRLSESAGEIKSQLGAHDSSSRVSRLAGNLHLGEDLGEGQKTIKAVEKRGRYQRQKSRTITISSITRSKMKFQPARIRNRGINKAVCAKAADKGPILAPLFNSPGQIRHAVFGSQFDFTVVAYYAAGDQYAIPIDAWRVRAYIQSRGKKQYLSDREKPARSQG